MQDLLKYLKTLKMMVIDAKTGKKADYGSTDTIIEVFKIDNESVNNFEEDGEKINYKLNQNNIFNFY